MRRIRGLKSLIHDTVDAVTHLVSQGHESTARTVMRVTDLVPPIAKPARTVNDVRRFSTEAVLLGVRAVNRAVETVSDAGLDVLEGALRERAGAELESHPDAPVPLRSDVMRTPAFLADALLALANAAVGDRLHARGNGLDLGMALRIGDRYVHPERAVLADAIRDVVTEHPRTVALFVHGLATTEWCWWLESQAYHGDPAASFGTLLQEDAGYLPVYARYNTGRHISENGRLLADELERFVDAYPGELEELLLIGHSMGGLVLRSAGYYATESGMKWPSKVKRVFCLGTPHQGAPLEKASNVLTAVLGAIDLPGTLIPARLLELRSAGIKDLRHGALVDEDWKGKDPDALIESPPREVPLLSGARYHFISATLTTDPDHPVGSILGDLLVRESSGSGPALEQHHPLPIEIARFGGVMHHQVQNHPAVYEAILRAVREQAPE